MRLHELISSVARRFPNLTSEDPEQELAVSVWADRKARDLPYNPDLELDDDEEAHLRAVCWNDCLDMCGRIIAQKRDYRRTERLVDPLAATVSSPLDWAIMGEVRGLIFHECRIDHKFLQALIDGDLELTRHSADVIDEFRAEGKARQTRPTFVLTAALGRRFKLNQWTVRRYRREVERAVLAVI